VSWGRGAREGDYRLGELFHRRWEVVEVKLLLSPHNDDSELFAAFTIIRERPTVCVVFDSYVQPTRGIPGCDAETRRMETERAIRVLTGDPDIEEMEVPTGFLGLMDSVEHDPVTLAGILAAVYPLAEHVWAPAFEEGGHDHHNLVALAAEKAFSGKVTHYLSYTRTGGKSRSAKEVLPRSGDDIARKLRALACYSSQLQMDPRLGCWPHFVNDLREYYQ